MTYASEKSAARDRAGADKPTAEILNVNELNALHKKDKEALRTKYDGKEVIVMGRAIEGFDPGAKRRSA